MSMLVLFLDIIKQYSGIVDIQYIDSSAIRISYMNWIFELHLNTKHFVYKGVKFPMIGETIDEQIEVFLPNSIMRELKLNQFI
jgi:hypothetical protein